MNCNRSNEHAKLHTTHRQVCVSLMHDILSFSIFVWCLWNNC